jgi:drug/metabolite transporter (DMT)-like permease
VTGTPRERDRVYGAAALSGTAFFWSLAGLLIKLVDWNPFAISFGRSVVASVFLLAWIRKPKFTFSMGQIGAAVSSSITMLLFVYAKKTTAAANAIRSSTAPRSTRRCPVRSSSGNGPDWNTGLR